MFFNRDRTETAISKALGKTVAGAYKQLKNNDLAFEPTMTALLRAINIFPEGTNLVKTIFQEELENLMTSANRTEAGAAVMMIGAAAGAYERWSIVHLPVSVPTRLQRLRLVPAGWRFDALTGLRYWLPSLIGEIAPVRAWMTDLYLSSAALSWDAAVKIENWIEFEIPALPYALQALALDSMISALNSTEKPLPGLLQRALQLASNGYADGLSKDMWKNISADARTSTGSHYNALALRAGKHGIVGIEPFETTSDGAIETHLALEDFLNELLNDSLEFGKQYSHLADEDRQEHLMRCESFIFSTIFAL